MTKLNKFSRKILTFLSVFFIMFVGAGNAFAEAMKTYDFTSNFIRCVKVHTAEGNENTTLGVADSSLMNGKMISKNGIVSEYWNYMSCLSDTVSPTANHVLAKSSGCPGFWFSLGGNNRKFKVQPGVTGKKINIKGVSFVCSNGVWDKTQTKPGIIPIKQVIDCDATIKKQGECSFAVPNIIDGGSKIVDSIKDGSLYQGSAKFICYSGVISFKNSSCKKQICDSGKDVVWGEVESDGDSNKTHRSTCQGTISSDGIATLQQQAIQYFDSLSEAKNETKISVGSASYRCDENKWVKKTSSCRNKTAVELSCKSLVDNNGNTIYYCK